MQGKPEDLLSIQLCREKRLVTQRLQPCTAEGHDICHKDSRNSLLQNGTSHLSYKLEVCLRCFTV
jgi:hypothetical protein